MIYVICIYKIYTCTLLYIPSLNAPENGWSWNTILSYRFLCIFRGFCCFRECISRYTGITKTFRYLKWRFPVLSSYFVGVVKVSLTSDVYIYIYMYIYIYIYTAVWIGEDSSILGTSMFFGWREIRCISIGGLSSGSLVWTNPWVRWRWHGLKLENLVDLEGWLGRMLKMGRMPL